MPDRVYIFDTTLRDGEQSPGCSMTVPEKVRMAAKLVDLGVDILEAGFPIASEGDFEAVSVGDRIRRTSLDAVSAENTSVVIDVINLCVALRAAHAMFRSVLRRLNIDAVGGT